MDMTAEHLDLLRVVQELEGPDTRPGTKAAGERLHQIWKDRGEPYAWLASAPWHGTAPYADDLRREGLLEVHTGMAKFRRWDQPVEPATQYSLALTDAGRQILVNSPGN